jgi:hypothetical protein
VEGLGVDASPLEMSGMHVMGEEKTVHSGRKIGGVARRAHDVSLFPVFHFPYPIQESVDRERRATIPNINQQ